MTGNINTAISVYERHVAERDGSLDMRVLDGELRAAFAPISEEDFRHVVNQLIFDLTERAAEQYQAADDLEAARAHANEDAIRSSLRFALVERAMELDPRWRHDEDLGSHVWLGEGPPPEAIDDHMVDWLERHHPREATRLRREHGAGR